MPRHFIAGADPLDKDQDKKFIEFIQKNNGTWWHWIPGLWLLYFYDDADIDQRAIWDAILNINPSARIFVTEVAGDNWIVSDIANSKGKKMDGWLKIFWSEGSE